MRRVYTSRLLFQCLLLLFGLSLVWSSNAGAPGPIITKGKGEHCVTDTDFMRRNHMELIIHQRDETFVRGIREELFSLAECVDCHMQKNANNKPVRIDAEGQFCASCHEYVAVKIDCFGCHSAISDTNKLGLNNSAHWLPDKRLMAFQAPSIGPLNPALQRDLSDQKESKPE